MDREAWQAYSPWGHKELDTTERLPNANISRAHQPPRPQQEAILRHSATLLTGHTSNPDFRVLPPWADRQPSPRAGPSARDPCPRAAVTLFVRNGAPPTAAREAGPGLQAWERCPAP
ncbi:unnamed protein product [Rangifer tarandus platyrhynchus]|uniref:Uncharacterized protein n=2 Tax=Rangifer tarandus platyrhynchus TaxID=3082113 RepID=A0AC59ZFX1_RANTA|nr:unnamed protein product [Rangifer tarandus platyrhynchus]